MSPFRFQVITLFPDMVQASMAAGVFQQAVKKDLLALSTLNPRDFTTDVHRTVDDRPFGGGDGMIMLAEPLAKTLNQARSQARSQAQDHDKIGGLAGEQKPPKVIYLSPQGKPLTHRKAQELSHETGLILLCGRYGGVDQRFLNRHVDEEISIGDYVLSGGELAACVLMDAVARFVPGVLGHHESADKDSFASGLLEQANFTRPREYEGVCVPEVLLGGNHKRIGEWKEEVSFLTTLAKRPDLIEALLSRTDVLTSSLNQYPRLAAKAYKLWRSMSLEEKALLALEVLNEESFQPEWKK